MQIKKKKGGEWGGEVEGTVDQEDNLSRFNNIVKKGTIISKIYEQKYALRNMEWETIG